MAVLSWLRRLSLVWLFGFNFLAWWSGMVTGSRTAEAVSEKALAELRQQHSAERAQAAQDNLLQYKQQVTRANQAEDLLLQVQQQLADAQQQLQERIPHVTTVYRPAPAAAPVAIPRCVFTAGWLRDLNAALGGSGLPAPDAGAAAAGVETAAGPAPGSDAELLESGITPADILAFAQDYGRWALGLHAQLTALQALHGE